MKLKLLKPWGFLEKGAVTDQPPPIAELLIGRQAAEEIKESKPRGRPRKGAK
jgi:hypothetical protein